MHHKAEEMRLAEERQREEAQMRRAQASADRQRPDGWILETAMQKPRHGYLHGARIQRQISLQDQYQDRSMDTRSPTTRHKHQLEEVCCVCVLNLN
jgi:hypothetical protein